MHRSSHATQRRGALRRSVPGWIGLISAAVALGPVMMAPTVVSAQKAAASLVIDQVTVVDVEQGKLIPSQRVVVTGNRIQAVGSQRSVSLPQGAQVVAVPAQRHLVGANADP